jgi:formate dehydrogenase major subunit/formate dehydrogenase alpha subunit
MTNSVEDLVEAQAIFVIGSNTTVAHPVIGYRIRKAVREHGAKLIVADPRRIPLVEVADIWLPLRPGTNVALLNAMMQVILEEGLADRAFIESRTEGFEQFAAVLPACTPEWAAPITGVPAKDIRRAARLYAGAERAAICYTMGITQHAAGTDNVLALANLAMLTGNIGKRGAGVNPLRGQNNVQGACDMGALPNYYTAYQKVDDPNARARFEAAWGVKLPSNPGLTLGEMIKGAAAGTVRGLYVMGENPLVTDPDIGHVRQAFDQLDFLVVQDIFLTETASRADVVLPAASFAEKNGTFTNTERRVQRVHVAKCPPGKAQVDWRIIAALSGALGYPMLHSSTAAIMEEIRRLTPSYANITYQRLESVGLHWSSAGPGHPGTPILHTKEFTRGRGLFSPVHYRPPVEEPDAEYPLVLTTGRSLWQYHSGSMTRRAPGLEQLAPRCWLEIHPGDAGRLGIRDGDAVTVASRRGAVASTARVTGTIKPGVVFMPFHYAEAAANELTNTAVDPVAKIPELKACAVRVAKRAVGQG